MLLNLGFLIELTRGRSSHRRCSLKNVFLEISQHSQENTCDRESFLIKLLKLLTLLKKSLSRGCYKIFKNTFFIEHLRTNAFSGANVPTKLLLQLHVNILLGRCYLGKISINRRYLNLENSFNQYNKPHTLREKCPNAGK